MKRRTFCSFLSLGLGLAVRRASTLVLAGSAYYNFVFHVMPMFTHMDDSIHMPMDGHVDGLGP